MARAPARKKKKPAAKPKKAVRGGARPGAGRPKKVVTVTDFGGVGEPPEDPLERNKWAQKILGIDLKRIVDGRADRALSQEIRATARTMASLIPLERVHDAEKTIKGDRATVKREGAQGAELERADERTAPVHRRLS